MANPFDDDQDNSYNPFAASEPYQQSSNSYYDAPKQDFSTYSQSTFYNPNPDLAQQQQQQQPQYEQKSEKTSTATKIINTLTGNKNDDIYVDPITKVPISQKDLDAKEAALNKREEELRAKEAALQNGTYQAPQFPKNFPPLLKFWKYYPDHDLPPNSVRMAKILFWIYNATGIVYLINFVGCLCCLNGDASEKVDSVATKIVLSLLFLIVFWPISFEISYFVLYNALMQGKAVKFFCFMLTFVIWIAILIFNLVGIGVGGSVGFIQMIQLFSAKPGAKFVAIIALIFCIVGSLDAAAMIFEFIHLIRYYKNEGFSKKAMKEASAYAIEKAKENPDLVIQAAKENPDLVMNASSYV